MSVEYFKGLHNTLVEEMKYYDKLKDLLEEETKFITQLNHKDLNINNGRKQAILERLAHLNEKRDFYIRQLAKDKKVEGELNLKKLIYLSPPELKDKYVKIVLYEV